MSSNKTPITPDGLFKLGAKEVVDTDCIFYDLQVGSGDHCMEIQQMDCGFDVCEWTIDLINVPPRGFNVPRNFAYIEEIQELYKSLTGEELKEVDNG